MYPRRLIPGIAVEVPPASSGDLLPRMDIATFVGFAERGPVHRAVAIDGIDAYRAVFGRDLPLARDAGAGIDLSAALPPAVRSFFVNGGTRAWVIRVCRTVALQQGWHGAGADMADAAAFRTFALPGATVDGTPLQLRAASLGGWADTMQISARIDRSLPRARLMLRASLDGDAFLDMGPFGIDLADPDSWWRQQDDDTAYAADDIAAGARSLLAPLGTPGPIDLSGLSDLWSQPTAPDPDPRTRLERDGLSRFDAELFLDPMLAGSGPNTLAADAARMHEIEGRVLFGLHGVFAIPGGADFLEPSILAVPDAVQPGWAPAMPAPLAPPIASAPEIPAAWRNHRGPCPPPADPGLAAPDVTRFLDCSTRLLPTPFLQPVESPRTLGAVTLAWSPSEDGATYILEESVRADFSGAEEIWRGTDLSFTVGLAYDGAYYYRLHAVLGDNVSGASVLGLVVEESAWIAILAEDYDDAPLLDVQAAALRTAQAIGDQFAILALPRHYRRDQATAHGPALAATLANQPRALSYGALYHPWLVTPRDATLVAVPPDGAVAGTMARESRVRGPWLAPARIPIGDIVALLPALPDTVREALAEARINLVRQDPHGFMATDALTLSPEPDWTYVNVRRLMSTLRRAAIRQGAPFVFEPNGETLRRAIERIFGHMLDEMVRRGAFAGSGADDSYRLVVTASDTDRMNGRLIIEIAVAPSLPLRFLTLVLAQAGERFSVAEER